MDLIVDPMVIASMATPMQDASVSMTTRATSVKLRQVGHSDHRKKIFSFYPKIIGCRKNRFAMLSFYSETRQQVENSM